MTVFRKFRNGFTPAGNSAANWIQGEASISQRQRGDVRVKRNGEFTQVFQGEVKQDGFYCLGRMTGEGLRITSSADARVFLDRGDAPTAGGFDTSQLAYYGKGKGVVTTTQALGSLPDFDGRPLQMLRVALYTTRTGKALTPAYGVEAFNPPEGTNFALMRGGYRLAGDKHVFHGGIHYTLLTSGGQRVAAFTYDDGETQTLAATPYFLNQLGWYSTPLVLAPGVMLKMDRYRRPEYEGSSVAVLSCPGLDFNYSADGGQTWNAVSSSAMFAAELSTITGLPAVPIGTYAPLFNRAIGAASITSAPLSRTLSVVLAQVPYVSFDTDPPLPKVRVKLGLVNVAAGCSLTETVVLFDGSPRDAAVFAGRGLLAIPGGVLLFTRPILPPGPTAGTEWNNPARVQFTSNGVGLVDRASMPLKENYTGLVTAINEKVLICPMWDGSHSLFQSLDFGATWTRRGLITKKGVPPDDAPIAGQEQYTLRDFALVTYLREGDVSANAFPMTPWLTDSRLPNPPPI